MYMHRYVHLFENKLQKVPKKRGKRNCYGDCVKTSYTECLKTHDDKPVLPKNKLNTFFLGNVEPTIKVGNLFVIIHIFK